MNEEEFGRLVKAVQFAIDDEIGPVEAGRPRWQQSTWATGKVVGSIEGAYSERTKEVCATGCCLAGTLVASAGGRFVISSDERIRLPEVGAPSGGLHKAVMPDGLLVTIPSEAERLLGVDSSRVACYGGCLVISEYIGDDGVEHNLFDASNEIEDVLHVASLIARRYGHDLRSALQRVDQLVLEFEVDW